MDSKSQFNHLWASHVNTWAYDKFYTGKPNRFFYLKKYRYLFRNINRYISVCKWSNCSREQVRYQLERFPNTMNKESQVPF